MDLTVLGASSRYLAPLGAGTSYLVRAGDGTRVLLDCGNGTHLRLAHELAGAPLAAVLVSHFHLDTVADLLPVAAALPRGAPLFVPRGASARLASLLRAYTLDQRSLEHVRLLGVGKGDEHVVGAITLRFAKGAHGCPGVATRLDDAAGPSLVYLADTAPRPHLAELARGADALVAHTLLLDKDEGPARERNMTAGDAGRLARAAGVGVLALSHVPFYANVEESLAEAQREFGGKVVVLRENERLAL